jgi:DNA-binding NarL/FixJ family response regulator
MIRVAITDDHLLVIKGLEELMRHLPGIVVVGSYLSIVETRNRIALDLPDMLFLDLNLPDGDGVTFCRELHGLYPNLKIIALTSFDRVSMVKGVMRNGASGYLLKNTSPEEVQEAIQTVDRGGQYLSPVLREAVIRSSLGQKMAGAPDLTRREKEVLELIVHGCTTQEIAEKLFLSVKTVEAHRSHIMDKLGVRNAAGLVKAAIDQGLC